MAELKIVSVHTSDTIDLSPDNRLQEMVVVNFVLSDSSTGSIKVPKTQFTAETIKALLAQELKKRQDILDSLE